MITQVRAQPLSIAVCPRSPSGGHSPPVQVQKRKLNSAACAKTLGESESLTFSMNALTEIYLKDFAAHIFLRIRLLKISLAKHLQSSNGN